jgi:hypothetical protein
MVIAVALAPPLSATGGLSRTWRAGQGSVTLRTLDASAVVPTRLHLRRIDGGEIVPAAALPLLGDCSDLVAPRSPEELAATARLHFDHARSGTRQFYSDGDLNAPLAPGHYRVTAARGPEYRVATQDFEVVAGVETVVDLHLERWIDMAARGWFSGDGHLHVGRPDLSRDDELRTWLGGEDLRVGNLLQWGNARGFNNAVQADFAPARGAVGGVPYVVLPGQESPRTEFMGHVMGLGVRRAIALPTDYLNVSRQAMEIRGAAGLVGIGHAGEWGGDSTVALLGAWNLLDFIEVFTFRTPDYQLWYEALNAGLRVAATAGSDFPCGGGQVPAGSPRIYAQVADELDAAAWLDAVRAGRTFVTNGPMIEFSVEGVGMGETLELPGPGTVTVRGTVHFDPTQESLRAFDLLRNGEVVAVYSAATAPGAIAFETTVGIHESSWLAVRSFGSKSAAVGAWTNSFAHSGAVFVRPRGTAAPAATARALAVRRSWRARLTNLFDRLADRGSHASLQGVGTDSAVIDDFARQALSLMREIQRTLDYAGLER